MFLENDFVIASVVMDNKQSISRNYLLDPEIYSIDGTNRTRDMGQNIQFHVSPNSSENYTVGDYLDEGRWKIQFTFKNQTSGDPIQTVSTSILVQPFQDFISFVTTIGTIAGTIATVTILGIQIHYHRTQIRQERSFNTEEKYVEHSKRIGRAMYDGCDESQGILTTCSYEAGQFRRNEGKEPESQFWPRAKQHFEAKEYKDLWELRKKAIEESVEKCDKLSNYITQYEKMVLGKIGSKFPDLIGRDITYSPSHDPGQNPRGYYTRMVLHEVFKESYEMSKGKNDNLFKNVDGGTVITTPSGERKTVQWAQLNYSGNTLYFGTQQEREEFKKMILDLMNDKEIQELVTKYHKLKNTRSDTAVELDKKRRDFWSNIEDGVPLEGSCSSCKWMK